MEEKNENVKKSKNMKKKIFYIIVLVLNILIIAFQFMFSDTYCETNGYSSSMEWDLFNQKFEQYAGENVNGANVKALIRKVRDNNIEYTKYLDGKGVSILFYDSENDSIEKLNAIKEEDIVNIAKKITEKINTAGNYIVDIKKDMYNHTSMVIIVGDKKVNKVNNEQLEEIKQQANFGREELITQEDIKKQQEKKEAQRKEREREEFLTKYQTIIDISKWITLGIIVITDIIIIIKLKNKKTKLIMAGILILGLCVYGGMILYSNIVIYSEPTVQYKPILYLYPTQTTQLSIKLVNEDKITCSYPKYKESWKIIANQNGTLLDQKTNRELYALYYENNNVKDYKIEKEGFVIKGTESAEFLEEKLAILGLNERESEEFIIYWLPKLEKNKYNYIRFASKEEIEENMPIEFSVEPDTLIRIMMTYKGLNKPIKVEEQELSTPPRNGFVVVEWGGSEIK